MAALLLGVGCASGQGLYLSTPDREAQDDEAYVVHKYQLPPNEEREVVRFFVTADAGVRDEIGGPHPDVVRVRNAGALACGHECVAAMFLGDNVYPHGVNNKHDADFLRDFAALYLDSANGFVPDIYFTPGNHDWGPVFPTKQRLEREFSALEMLGEHVHGASHFFTLELDELHLASIDSNYLVQHCKPQFNGKRLGRGHSQLSTDSPGRWEPHEFQCIEPGENQMGRHGINEGTLRGLIRGNCSDPSCREHTVVLGHHPWFGNGTHGTAGWYRDFSSFSLGSGASYRIFLERVVRPRAALYLAGHDHGVHVHLDPAHDESLSVTVGSGGKVAARAERTAEGEKFFQDNMEMEGFCRLGFAVVEHSYEGLAVEVFSLNGTESSKCLDGAQPAQSAWGEPVAGGHHDLRCRRWELEDEGWVEATCQDPPQNKEDNSAADADAAELQDAAEADTSESGEEPSPNDAVEAEDDAVDASASEQISE